MEHAVSYATMSHFDDDGDGYVGFNSFLAEQMRTSIPKVTNGVMKVALNSFLRMAHILRMVGAG